MASLVIRDLEAATKQALRELAAQNGRSMEAEARDAIKHHVDGGRTRQSLRAILDEVFPVEIRGDIDFGDRADDRDPPKFGE